ncbi:931_t:CDS:2, partial [Racocetra fulgida]
QIKNLNQQNDQTEKLEDKYNKNMKPYNLQEIFKKEIKVGQCFHGLFEEYYRIVKTLKMNPENNFAKVLVDDESKHKIMKFKSKPEDTETIKYDFFNGYRGEDKRYYVKKIHFLTEKEVVYSGYTIKDENDTCIEHHGGCFGGDQPWHHRIFSDDRTDEYRY